MRQTEARHVFFIVDACFAGALFRATMDDAPKGIRKAYEQRSRRLLTSGNLEEVADDSKFFEMLKQYLQKNPVKYSSALNLANFLRTNAEGITPQYERINDLKDYGGDFIFVRSSVPVTR